MLQRFKKQEYLEETVLEETVHLATDFVHHYLDNHVEQITLQATQNCNLRCSYCAYGNNYVGQRGHSNITMSFEAMKKSIDFLMARSRNVDEVAVAFYGGEPLLELEKIKLCVEYIKGNYKDKLGGALNSL